MKSDLLYALSKGRLKTAVSGFSSFYYFRFLRFLVSSVIGSVSEIPVRFPVSGSVHKFPDVVHAAMDVMHVMHAVHVILAMH